MKSVPRVILCFVAVLGLSTLFILNLPVKREGEPITDNKLSIVYVVGWSMNTTRNTSQYVYVNNSTANIMPEHVCEKPNLLLTMVCSAPANFEARKAIRDTWGSKESQRKNSMALYFLVGETENSTVQADLFMENEHHNDIIQERFIDSYNNLTLKSIQMIKIASNYCINSTKYLFKIDDDMYVNVPLLVNLLVEKNQTKEFMIGKLICGAKPIKNPTSKWFAPEYMYRGKEYPKYLSGTGYLMSIDVAPKLLEVSMTTPIFHLEDVYLTGICSKKVNIRRLNDNRFTFRNLKDNYCQNMRYITMHHFNPDRLRNTYEVLNDPEVISACEARASYNTTTTLLVDETIKPSRTRRKLRCG